VGGLRSSAWDPPAGGLPTELIPQVLNGRLVGSKWPEGRAFLHQNLWKLPQLFGISIAIKKPQEKHPVA